MSFSDNFFFEISLHPKRLFQKIRAKEKLKGKNLEKSLVSPFCLQIKFFLTKFLAGKESARQD